MGKSKFNFCYTNQKGVTWCQHVNGNWAPPFYFNSEIEKPSSENDKGIL
jgi:hypothetical protein